ncbi:hypothetical protein DYB32_009055 [Aphanomyces invadans]|uniref:AAA+ ATPase domain-containing protein n=1 Tax=Aphanomyces invadans TaxID=157072 RepID=A0A418AJE4_9STRA|nr:hypothetical protein DYB32_009055 [Aphanomyces invadans]
MKGPTKIPRGLYIYGQVGTGKSMLMDLFYSKLDNKKRRVHFHAFLLEVHRRIHQRKQEHLETYGRSMHIELQPERDIIGTIAKEIAAESPVLCFDEFQPMEDSYFTPVTPEVQKQVQAIVDALLEGRPPLQLETIPVMMGRTLQVKGQGDICVVDFATLCNTEKGAADYKALSERFRVVVLTDIPQMTLAMHNQVTSYSVQCVLFPCRAPHGGHFAQARRFITLLDELYEHKVRLICTADVEPDELFNFDIDTAKVPLPVSLAMKQTELRNLQANHIKPFTSWDGPVAHDPATSSSDDRVKNMSSMTDLLYACKRAVSRLHEMRTSKYQLHFPNADT